MAYPKRDMETQKKTDFVWKKFISKNFRSKKIRKSRQHIVNVKGCQRLLQN